MSRVISNYPDAAAPQVLSLPVVRICGLSSTKTTTVGTWCRAWRYFTIYSGPERCPTTKTAVKNRETASLKGQHQQNEMPKARATQVHDLFSQESIWNWRKLKLRKKIKEPRNPLPNNKRKLAPTH